MSAPTDGTGVPPGDGSRVEQVDLQLEMQRSYLDYAMSVIVSRALPDVRDGLKPVHRRVLYAMYDGGYRPDRGYNKCARVVGDVMGNYHPHGDSAIYDTLVRLAQPWALRYPLVDGQGNFGSPGNDPAAAMRYTECRLAPLAMEMVREIDEDTVDFVPNYDGKVQEPVVLPARFPNLLVNGSAGIAVGMATNIPPHNLREVAAGVLWALEHPDATREELQEALLERIPGPDFPTGGLIMGRRGIEDAYRTGRGSITMRAVVDVAEIDGRTCLVVTELPYTVNPDNLAQKIADLVKEGRVQGVADVKDHTSSRTGQRLVIVLRRDAVPQVVLNNLYKHTQLQETFGANMLALVDGVPRTLTLAGFVHLWIIHQLDVVVRRTQYRLRKAQERAHILRGLLAALDRIEEVIALIRASASAEEARTGLMGLLSVDEVQATEILNMQLRRLAALERSQLTEQYDGLMRDIAGYEEVLASPARQRGLIAEELTGIVDRFGDERRTRIVPAADEMSMEDLIPAEPVVVTLTRGGYAKRTRLDLYRTQRRGGKGVRGAALRGDDVVEHFFVTSTHHWVLFFTDKGRVYRAKAYELPEGGRDARGQHVANLLALAADERIAAVLTLKDYDVAPYLVLATRHGFVKKTRLTEYDSPRAGGIIAISLRHPDDRVIGAKLVAPEDDVLLVSRKGQALRFRVDDSALRPMGRATSGVTGMRFRPGDELLTLARIPADVTEEMALVTVTDAGYAKRTSVDAYRRQGRGGFGVRAARLSDERGGLVGSLVAVPGDEMLLIMASGKVVRTSVRDVPAKGRDTMGVIVAKPDRGDTIVAVTRNPEPVAEEDVTHLTVTDAADDAGQVTASGASALGGSTASADPAPADLAPEGAVPEDVAPDDMAPDDLAPDDGTADRGGEQGSDSS